MIIFIPILKSSCILFEDGGIKDLVIFLVISKLKEIFILLHLQQMPMSENRLLEREELNKLLLQQELYWKQRSSVSWLKEGDKNTKLFQMMAVNRKQKNTIASILKDNGDPTFIHEEISNSLVSHFHKLFTATETSPVPAHILAEFSQIDAAENDHICSIPTEEEIKVTLKNMQPLKSPGPDGYPAFFYQSCWNTVNLQHHGRTPEDHRL